MQRIKLFMAAFSIFHEKFIKEIILDWWYFKMYIVVIFGKREEGMASFFSILMGQSAMRAMRALSNAMKSRKSGKKRERKWKTYQTALNSESKEIFQCLVVQLFGSDFVIIRLILESQKSHLFWHKLVHLVESMAWFTSYKNTVMSSLSIPSYCTMTKKRLHIVGGRALCTVHVGRRSKVQSARVFWCVSVCGNPIPHSKCVVSTYRMFIILLRKKRE